MEDWHSQHNKLIAIRNKLNELIKEYADAYVNEGYIDHRSRKIYKIIIKELKVLQKALEE